MYPMKDTEGWSFQSLETWMADSGVRDELKDYFRQCVSFHTFPAPGLMIGVFMTDYAVDLLGARPGEKLYAVSETTKCAPDPLQVILHCTTGNHRLRVIPVGKFAITVNRPSTAQETTAVRVFVDPVKVGRYPLINRWFSNDPGFDPRRMAEQLLREILQAGRGILSAEKVTVRVTPKQKWHPVICPVCHEPVPHDMLEDGVCRGCGPMAYYRKEGPA